MFRYIKNHIANAKLNVGVAAGLQKEFSNNGITFMYLHPKLGHALMTEAKVTDTKSPVVNFLKNVETADLHGRTSYEAAHLLLDYYAERELAVTRVFQLETERNGGNQDAAISHTKEFANMHSQCWFELLQAGSRSPSG